jgi:hypothetical protein
MLIPILNLELNAWPLIIDGMPNTPWRWRATNGNHFNRSGEVATADEARIAAFNAVRSELGGTLLVLGLSL